jgi:hypothetical protein
MSREKKDERNRKERERRRMKKALSDGNRLGQVHVPMEENVDTECLQSEQLTEHYQQTGSSDLLFNILRVNSRPDHLFVSCSWRRGIDQRRSQRPRHKQQLH